MVSSMNEAHVICCNDSVEHVCTGSLADAGALMHDLCRQDYLESVARGSKLYTFEDYSKRMHWHIYSWDDSIVTSWTPAPSARCPFEHYHRHD